MNIVSPTGAEDLIYNSPGLGPVGVSDHQQCAFEILTLTIFIDLKPFQFIELFGFFLQSKPTQAKIRAQARPQPDLSQTSARFELN